MRTIIMTVVAGTALMALGDSAVAQLADLQPGRNFPTASIAFGTGRSENIDVGDVDSDGDFDVVVANGGDGSPQANEIYMNNGGAQGGTPGTFANQTSLRFVGVPADRSRDIEFADFDNDCDLDIYVSNRGTTTDGGEPSRAYINQGAMQFGVVGVFREDTDLFFRALISVPAGDQVLGGNTGSWRDYSCDCDFGDLDLDGDLDLFHSSYGPNINGTRDSRVFLNDGTGHFDELWPWVDAAADIKTHTLDMDLVDLDGDLDIDVFMSSRNSAARVFRNNLQADGSFPADAFTDVTQTSINDTGATGSVGANYEAEYGDVDGDGDFDIYMKNYGSGTTDRLLINDGNMAFTKMDDWINGDPGNDENEVDFLDFDGDGDLDVFLANFSGTNWLYASGLSQGLTGSNLLNRTGTTSGGSNYASAETPSSSNSGTTLDGECADMDGDGDTDILLSNDGNQPNRYWENTLGVPDTHAPTIHLITSQGDKADGSDTPIRVQIRDNTNYYEIGYYKVDLLYSINGGIENRIKMFSQASQQFQAVIPGGLTGNVSWRVVGSDRSGNGFSSSPASYVQTASGVALLQNVDDGTGGVAGNPYLQLKGSFVGATVVSANLCDAAPNALAVLFASIASTPLPFKGGLLHTVPIVLQLSLLTDVGGQVYFETNWPPGVVSNASLWFQYGVADAAGIGGATLSNAVKVTTPAPGSEAGPGASSRLESRGSARVAERLQCPLGVGVEVFGVLGDRQFGLEDLEQLAQLCHALLIEILAAGPLGLAEEHLLGVADVQLVVDQCVEAQAPQLDDVPADAHIE